MRIGEVSEACGVTIKALRYYESIGLIDPPERTPSGYRNYQPQVLGRLAFIRAAQAVDLTLAEIGEIVAFRERGVAPCGHVLELIERRAADIDARIEQLTRIRQDLRSLSARGQTLDPADCGVDAVCHVLTPEPRHNKKREAALSPAALHRL